LAFKTGKFLEFNLRRQFEFQILLILSAILLARRTSFESKSFRPQQQHSQNDFMPPDR